MTSYEAVVDGQAAVEGRTKTKGGTMTWTRAEQSPRDMFCWNLVCRKRARLRRATMLTNAVGSCPWHVWKWPEFLEMDRSILMKPAP